MIITKELIIKELSEPKKSYLIATQDKICLPIIHRICNKMLLGVYFEPIKVHENAIIDSHHRYISSVISGIKIDEVPGYRTETKENVSWVNVEIVIDDYETESRINMHNIKDSKRSEIDIEKLENL